MIRKLFILFVLLIASLSSCNTHKTVVQDSSTPESENSSLMVQNVENKETVSTVPDHLMILHIFVDSGFDAFYRVYRRVPNSFDEYIQSGIPMLIPNDYISGQVYHIVDKIDFNDTSGFTFSSDGVDNCQLDFIVKNLETEEKEILSFKFDENNWRDYKIVENKPGILFKEKFDFDRAKRYYCISFFSRYSYIYAAKHNGEAPESLSQLFQGQGSLIEKGWQWVPEPGQVRDYFEFGFDIDKDRLYHIQGSKYQKPGSPMSVIIHQLYGPDKEWQVKENGEIEVKGVDWWEFKTDEVPTDIIEMKPYITSKSFYSGYEEITG